MSKVLIQPFEDYQKSRQLFVQQISDLAQKPQNVQSLQKAGSIYLLKTLLQDPVAAIQQNAAFALAKMASHFESIAQEIVQQDIIPILIFNIKEQNRYYKKAAAYLLKSIAKHSIELAQTIVQQGAISALIICLQEFDSQVKENAAIALSQIAKHDEKLSEMVVQGDTIQILLSSIQEPEIDLKWSVLVALSEICKHNAQLAKYIVDLKGIQYLSNLLSHKDVSIKKSAINCLSNIAKHKIEFSEEIVSNNSLSKVIMYLKDSDLILRKNSTILLKEISKHSASLCSVICNIGGGISLIQFLEDEQNTFKIPALMCVGFIGTFDEANAMSLINAQIIWVIREIIYKDEDQLQKAAACWAIGQICGHSYNHTKNICETDLPLLLVQNYLNDKNQEELRIKSKKSFKRIVLMINDTGCLDSLIKSCDEKLLTYVLRQLKKFLPNSNQAKKQFILTNSLKFIQEQINTKSDKLRLAIEEIVKIFPPEIAQYYNPGYQDTLIKKLEVA